MMTGVSVICLLLLLVLAGPANSQQTVPLCPNNPLPDPSPFTCTSQLTHFWNGSAFMNQCPSDDDDIALTGAGGLTNECGMFSATASFSNPVLTSSLSFTPAASLDGNTIQCFDINGLVPTSDFVIEITESLQIRSIVDSSLECVTVELEPLTDTTGIVSYTVVALLGDTEVSQGTSDDAANLVVEVCGLRLCDNDYMFQAMATGGSICPSNFTAATDITLSALNQVGNVRLNIDGSDLEWDAPSNAVSAGCTVEQYSVSVNGDPPITTTTTSVSFSMLGDPQPDTCDSGLSITVTASVPTLSLVAGSISDAFNPSSAFPALLSDSVTTGITYASELIMVELISNQALADARQPFPDAEFNVMYSSAEPGCGQTMTTLDNVLSVNYACLDVSLIGFSVTLVDDPACSSNTINIEPLPSFPLVADSIFQPTPIVRSNSAEIPSPTLNNIMVAADSFDTLGTAFQTSDNTVAASDTRTYPANTVFRGLDSDTSYMYMVQIVSKANGSIVLGSYSGTFTTLPPSDDGFPLWVIAIIVVVVVLLIAGFIIGHFIYQCYENYPGWLVVTIVILCFLLVGIGIALYILIRRCCCSSSGKAHGKPDEHPLRVRAMSDGSPADVERAVAADTAPTYADPNTIERQEFPGTGDVYTVVDTKKKTPKPEDLLPTYQVPESIKREAAPATGELYTVPEGKKGSKKKKEAPLPEYSQVDLQKKHQPPSGLTYSELNLPPAGKTPDPKTVEYTDIRPHS